MIQLVQEVSIPQPRRPQFILDDNIALKLQYTKCQLIENDQTIQKYMQNTAEFQRKKITTERKSWDISKSFTKNEYFIHKLF